MSIKRADNLKLKYLTIFTALIFVSILVFFLLYSKPGVSPDGLDHLNFAIHGIPKINLIGPATQDFPIKHVHFYSTGYGYHYFLHFLYKSLAILSSNSINETYWITPPFLSKKKLSAAKANLLLVVRIISVILTCLQVYVLKKICEILQVDYIYPIALLWLSISIMFPFLHSNISRDVLINLLAICFTYNILSFHIYRKVKNIKYIMLICAIAPFVQLSLCAFIATVLASYAILYTKSFRDMNREILQIIKLKKGYLFPVILGIVAFPATADLLNKIIQYNSIKPGCEQMFSYEKCREKNTTFKMYYHLKVLKAKNERINLLAYLKAWYPGLFKRIFGIMGHKSYLNPNALSYILINLISILFIISTAFGIRKKRKSILLLGLISLMYFFVIFYFVNRRIYLFTGVLSAALQGRYAFPVYPLMVVFAHSCFGHLHRIVYYSYAFLLFGILLATYFIFLSSPQIKSIIMIT